MPDIRHARILIMATNGFEQSELEVPRDRLRAAYSEVHVASTDGLAIRGWSLADGGRPVPADLRIADARAAEYDALVLPGDRIDPDRFCVDTDAMAVVQAFLAQKKPIASICHAPRLLIRAGAVRNRRVTSCPSIRNDLETAGAHWVDAEVVVDRGMITSRSPADLEPFVAAIIDAVIDQERCRSDAA